MTKEEMERSLEKLENFIIYKDLRARFETLNPKGQALYKQICESEKFTTREAVAFVEYMIAENMKKKESEKEQEQ